ncbi:hypothetical protein BDY17DRAFT_288770 [Neohortaea acidophila]|uniref:REJ domain-containing protein n=1 Tax=Neohortaea acidophila TaxID=245834 RepID=A0A6A6Q5K1_9PEZI|nr:uncharacterized protein BDY17DRAFT_288770 [Neohortaea acidophila]KAF2487341.1 hypothetical protein BDY17DRAFT_288770 [Neohortaea acidophila]
MSFSLAFSLLFSLAFPSSKALSSSLPVSALSISFPPVGSPFLFPASPFSAAAAVSAVSLCFALPLVSFACSISTSLSLASALPSSAAAAGTGASMVSSSVF